MNITTIRQKLHKLASPKKAKLLQRFFKTGPGEYGEGDTFIGVKVPEIRKVAKQYRNLSLAVLRTLLRSKIHEERLLALLILVSQFEKASVTQQEKIYDFYLKHTKYINNWDLVDLTAHHIVGAHLFKRSKKPLMILARSSLLWERRIAIVAAYYFIRHERFTETFKISRILLKDTEDLIHKAVGWMLREAGKRDQAAEETFLQQYYHQMPRTMLRYAIERFPEKKRQAYLKGRI